MNGHLLLVVTSVVVAIAAVLWVIFATRPFNGLGEVKMYYKDGGIINPTEVDDVIAWADSIAGAMGTEHCDRVTLKEILIANAIINTINRMPEEERNNARS